MRGLLLLTLFLCGCAQKNKTLEPCIACEAEVSIEADKCPYCGEPVPTKAKRIRLLNTEAAELNERKAALEAEKARVVVGWGNLPEHVELDLDLRDIDKQLQAIDKNLSALNR